MPFRVTCTTCATRFALSDDLYERKIKNRIVTIRCKSCSSDISVDGEALAATATTTSSTANEPQIDADSLPPSARPPPDLTPTVPLKSALEAADAQQTPTPAVDTKNKTEGLWVVCCPDEDDRELTLPEIEAAIAKNEINGDAIVWRDGMAEWLPIYQVPELRVLLKKPPLPKPKGRTLLGIGVKANTGATRTPKPVPKPPAPVSDPDNEPVSVEPEPVSESSAQLLAQRKGGAVALSPGLLSVKRVDEGARPEPPPRRRQDSIPEPPPRPKLDSIPEPPPRPKMDSKPDAPARPRMDSRPDGVRLPKPPTPVRPVPKLLLEERGPDSAPDSSGTPNLRALASVVPKKSRRPEEDKKPPPDEFIWGGSSDTELLGAPTIDVAGLSAPPVAGPTAKSDAPPSSKKKKSSKKSRRPKPPDEPIADKVTESASAEVAASKAEPEKKSGTGLLILIAGAVLVVGGFLLVRGKKAEPPPEPVPTQVAAPTPSPAPTPEPVAAPPPVLPEPAAAASAEPPKEAPQAAEPAAKPREEPRPERPAREEPASAETKPAAPETATKPAETEKGKPAAQPVASAAPAAQPAEGAPAAAFDKAAASAALSAAAAQASACRKEGDPTGAAAVVVTFAPSGRVTSANVNGPPFAGTATGGCIAAAMRRAKVPPFSGAHVTVGKTVAIR